MKNVTEANRNFMKMFKSLKIRAKFGAGEQAMVVYDVDIPEVMESFPSASLLNFRNGQIVRIELFYDGSCFVETQREDLP